MFISGVAVTFFMSQQVSVMDTVEMKGMDRTGKANKDRISSRVVGEDLY